MIIIKKMSLQINLVCIDALRHLADYINGILTKSIHITNPKNM